MDGFLIVGGPSTLWQCSVLAYVLLMFIAGWREGSDPTFHCIPGAGRNAIYSLRLILGSLMLIASGEWLLQASRLLRAGRISDLQEQRG